MKSDTKSGTSLKTLVIGLDGATFDLMLPFIKEGRLPAFTRLLEEGAWGRLRSTIPPITAAAWTSFMTGCNPGKHGILDFISVGMNANEEEKIVTTKSFAGKTFFDFMSGNKMKVGVITVPVTYPPWSINGIMISGYPCPDNDKIYAISKDISINIDEPLNFSSQYYKTATEEQIIEDCLYRDKLRADLTFDLLDRYEFGCFAVVFGGIDRSQHDYWKYHDPDYPGVSDKDRAKFRDSIYRNYRLADEEISKFLDRYGNGVNIFILSDHGAGRRAFHYFNVNLWLKKKGYLGVRTNKALKREVLRLTYFNLLKVLTPKNKKRSSMLPKIRRKSKHLGGGSGAAFNWDATKAFFHPLSYPTGGITINLKGRQPKGIIEPGREYNRLIDDIIRDLLECIDDKTGEKVVEEAVRREDVYRGAFVSNFPDIIYRLNPGYESGRELYGRVISPVPRFLLSKKSGMHLMDGIFIAHGPKIKPGEIKGAEIIDVAPTVLYATGLPIPKDMDGVLLKDIFKGEVLRRQPVEYVEWDHNVEPEDFHVDNREDEEMEEKLRSLGYL